MHRSTALLACADKAEVKDVLVDATALKVPLLKYFLLLRGRAQLDQAACITIHEL